jgi:hypothetical protein
MRILARLRNSVEGNVAAHWRVLWVPAQAVRQCSACLHIHVGDDDTLCEITIADVPIAMITLHQVPPLLQDGAEAWQRYVRDLDELLSAQDRHA